MRAVRTIVLGTLLPLIAGAPPSGDAALAQARGDVSVMALRNLEFENVLPGVVQAVAPGDPVSGKWLVQGDPNAQVVLAFPGLPATLSAGGDQIPITFPATGASYCATDDPGSATPFDPAAGVSVPLSSSGQLIVWIGGIVDPPESAAAGTYSAAITLEVVYE